jgi:HEAT repeat protein
VPESAVGGLGQFGGLATPAVPKLLQLLKAPDKDMRHAAIIALEQIAPEEAAKAGH